MLKPEMSVADQSSRELWVCHLGVVAYRDALAIQEHVRARRQADELPDTLLLLEHPPVYTRGRRSGAQDLPFGEDFYRAKDIDVVSTDRGGKLTYHSPGQLVGYPIMRIDDVHRYLRTMEGAIVAALADEGIAARSRHDEGIDYTGVWVKDRKIASIGVHVSRGVTTHGFAVNVHNDLEPFSWVVACGLPDVSMTSLAIERTAARCDPALACFRKRMAYAFSRAHGRRQRLVSPARIGIDTANAARRASGRAPIKTISPPPVEPVPV
jgi:lipoyl(octanoyl) transferase